MDERYRLAWQALVLVIQEEFGERPVSEVVATWTPLGVTPEMLEAVRQVEEEV